MDYNKMTKEELIEYINSLNEEQSGKFGLVWDKEKEPEQIVVDCDKYIPILEEDKKKEIQKEGQNNILIDNGDPMWYKVDENGDYVLDAAGKKTTTNDYNDTYAHAVGTATPMFSGGLNTTVSWNGIFLHLNSNYQYGNKIYNYTRHSSDADGAYLGYNQLSIKESKLGWKRWEKAGDVATHPKAMLNGNKNANQISSRYLEDGSYFRIKNLTVGYDFPTQLISKAKMTKCRLYFSADNLWTASRFSGMDPEITLESSANNLAGFYSENYPVGRTFQGGVEISF